MKLKEVYIQDAVTNSKRLLKIINEQLNLSDWAFVEGEDIIIQEHSFSAGRIDVLATFNNKTKLAIIETKAYQAGIVAITQLLNYLDNLESLLYNPKLENVNKGDVIAIIIAKGFYTIPERYGKIFESESRIRFVKFTLGEDSMFSFEEIKLEDKKKFENIPVSKKFSSIQTIDDTLDKYDPDFRVELRKLLNCFQNDKNELDFVVANPKGSHIWVKYRGEQVLCLWPKGKELEIGLYIGDVWYGPSKNEKFNHIISGTEDVGDLKALIENRVKNILRKLQNDSR